MQDTSSKSFIVRAWRFYIDGFRDMSLWGRKIWIIILIKLFIIFVVIKLLFMPDFLKKNFRTDQQRSNHVLENLTNSN